MIVSWNTTNQCNMYCSHCYREAGKKAYDELDTAEARKLLQEIASAGFKIMIFSGGEPLMRSDIIELVSYASSLGMRPVMGSNGTLLTRGLAMELKKAGLMGIGISLDSISYVKHDGLRCYPGGWKEALRGMENSKAAGLPFQIHTTVLNWNRDEITSITDLAVEMGAVGHHIFFLVPTGRGANIAEDSLSTMEYEELLSRLLDKQSQVKIEIKPTCAPQFMRIAKQKGLNLRFSKGCLAGTSYCIISPTGNVQPCAYLNISAGNIRETPFDRIWQESKIFRELRTEEYGGGCGSCRYKSVCGGCRARAYYYHGDYMAGEPRCLYQGNGGD